MLKVEKLKTFIQKFYIFLNKNEITFKKFETRKENKIIYTHNKENIIYAIEIVK